MQHPSFGPRPDHLPAYATRWHGQSILTDAPRLRADPADAVLVAGRIEDRVQYPHVPGVFDLGMIRLMAYAAPACPWRERETQDFRVVIAEEIAPYFYHLVSGTNLDHPFEWDFLAVGVWWKQTRPTGSKTLDLVATQLFLCDEPISQSIRDKTVVPHVDYVERDSVDDLRVGRLALPPRMRSSGRWGRRST